MLVDIAGITRIEFATGLFMADLGLSNFMLLMSSGNAETLVNDFLIHIDKLHDFYQLPGY